MTETREARERSREVADDASQKGRQVASSGKEQAAGIAGEAREEGRQLTAEAREQATNVVEEAKQQMRSQADAQADNLAAGLERFQEQARALISGRREEAGPLGDYADEVIAKAGELASGVRSRGFEGLVDDAQRFARRRPGAFLAGAAATGFLAGRLFRGARDDHGQPQGYGDAGSDVAVGQPLDPAPAQAAVAPAPVAPATRLPADDIGLPAQDHETVR